MHVSYGQGIMLNVLLNFSTEITVIEFVLEIEIIFWTLVI